MPSCACPVSLVQGPHPCPGPELPVLEDAGDNRIGLMGPQKVWGRFSEMLPSQAPAVDPGTQRALQMRDHVYQNSYYSICQMRRLRPREVEPLAQNHTAGVSGGTKVHPSSSPWYLASLGTWSISIFCTPSRAPVSTRVQFQKWSCWVKGCVGLNCDGSARYFPERLHTSSYGWSCSLASPRLSLPAPVPR